MPHNAVVVFTAKSLEDIIEEGGSGDWRLDPVRARQAEYLICTQNRHNTGFGAPTAQHGHAFLIGRIAEIVRSPKRPDRWLVNIREYTACNIPNIWGKNGHLRYPVWYTTLEDLEIDLGTLPPFEPLPGRSGASGLSEASSARLIPTESWPTTSADHARMPGRHARRDDQAARARMDAILAQLDRVPDLPNPFDPLDWDEHGLPR
jgi:hypothetical protein